MRSANTYQDPSALKAPEMVIMLYVSLILFSYPIEALVVNPYHQIVYDLMSCCRSILFHTTSSSCK